MLTRLSLLSAQSMLLVPPAGRSVNEVVVEMVGKLIQVAAVLLAMTIGLSFLEGMIGHMTDNASMVHNIWPRILAAILCLVLAVFAIPISNTVIDVFGGAFRP